MYYHWIKDIGGHNPACFLIPMIWIFNLMKPSAILKLLWWKVPKVYHPLCKVLLNISNWFQYRSESPGVCIVRTGEPWICILLTITCMICLVIPSLSLPCSKLNSQNFLIFFFQHALCMPWIIFMFSCTSYISLEMQRPELHRLRVWLYDRGAASLFSQHSQSSVFYNGDIEYNLL